MSPPIPLTMNVATASVPISEEETALLADEQHIQQETNDIERLLATKHKECKDLAEKWKVAQMKCEEETKVRARTLAEVVVAEVRWATKHANDHTKDMVRKATDELQRLQSPAKGKCWLVRRKFSSSGDDTEESIGKCYASEGEGHAGKGEGFAGSRKEWWVEAEGEQVAPVGLFCCLTDSSARNQDAAGCLCDHCMNGGVTCSWPPREKHMCNKCIWRKGKCTIGRASVTQRAPHGTGPVCKKACVVS